MSCTFGKSSSEIWCSCKCKKPSKLKGVVKNCQHYQERTQSTPACPAPSGSLQARYGAPASVRNQVRSCQELSTLSRAYTEYSCMSCTFGKSPSEIWCSCKCKKPSKELSRIVNIIKSVHRVLLHVLRLREVSKRDMVLLQV